ncbi:MAG: VTT domain-containing protein [Patescibacteria group bacterium]
MNNIRKYFSIFLFIIIAAFIFWGSLSIQEIFYEIVFFIEDYAYQNEILAIAVFVGLSALSAIVSPFSSAPLAPIAVMIWGSTAAFTMLFSGWLIGDIIAYLIGRYGGRLLVEQFVDFNKIENYLAQIPVKIKFWLVLLFRLTAPSEIGGYVLGVLRYYFGKYFLATFLAELPFALITIYASEAFIDQKITIFVALIFAMLVLMSATFYAFRHQIKKHHKTS